MDIAVLIPARIGSKRLPRKNLADFCGAPLIAHAIQKALLIADKKDVYVSSDSAEILKYAIDASVNAIERPAALANDSATSEDFIEHAFGCLPHGAILQLHTIAPLLSVGTIASFVEFFRTNSFDVLLSGVTDQIEVMENLRPINFDFNQKTNSQNLSVIQKITWPLTIWRRDTFLDGRERTGCGTYHGSIGFYGIDDTEAKVIKTLKDLEVCRAIANGDVEGVWCGFS